MYVYVEIKSEKDWKEFTELCLANGMRYPFFENTYSPKIQYGRVDFDEFSFSSVWRSKPVPFSAAFKKRVAADYAKRKAELEGELHVFKKVNYRYKTRSGAYDAKQVIAVLTIPAGTPRYVTVDKCRAAEALVTGYTDLRGKALEIDMADQNVYFWSIWDRHFKYPKEGGIVQSMDKTYENRSFANIREKCASGIHFFRTFGEAKEYML